MADRQKLANALMQPPQEQAPGLMGAAPDWRQKIGNALMGGADYAGRGLALADLYSGGMLSSVAGLNPFTSYGNVMEARDRALEAVPREAKAAATEPFNPLMAMAMVPAATKRGIKAFHGSPHDFDKFSLDHIGKGEGAQAYGHGLYFAESEGVAKSYRDALKKDAKLNSATDKFQHLQIDGQPLNKQFDIDASYIDELKPLVAAGDQNAIKSFLAGKRQRWQQVSADPSYPFPDYAADKLRAYDGLMERLGTGGKIEDMGAGRMYEVNIKADPEDFLDWDKPFSQQPKAAQSVLESLEIPHYGKPWSPEAKGPLADAERNAMPLGNFPGLVKYLQQPGTPDALRDAGIPGIRYLDASSRGAGDGSRNLVLFRDDIIDIVKKYGMAAAVSMYGANAVMQATGGDQQQ
jgi:hypothetical protein